jgi:hypothetical protein
MCAPGTHALFASSTLYRQSYTGHYSSSSGSHNCSTCSAGAVASAYSSTSCTTCPAGEYRVHPLSCDRGSLRYEVLTAVLAPGYIAASRGLSSCSACAAGYYAAQSGSSTCASCSPGELHSALAAHRVDAASCREVLLVLRKHGVHIVLSWKLLLRICIEFLYTMQRRHALCDCPSGAYASCVIGSYASGYANTSCAKCAAGAYASGVGNTKCTTCAAGMRACWRGPVWR